MTCFCHCCHRFPRPYYGSMKNSKSMDTRAGGPRTIVFLAAPNTQILDVAGPFQVFVRAAELFVEDYPSRKRPYNVALASSTHRKTVTTNCGLGLIGTQTFRSLGGPIDTLLVAGGTGLENAARDEELLAWLRTAAQRVRRIGSICTGAFLLAAAGLLDGKRATTHWKWAAELAKRSKRTTVDPDPIYIRDGNPYTTAGITAGMDLALGLVEEDGTTPGPEGCPRAGPVLAKGWRSVAVQHCAIPAGFGP